MANKITDAQRQIINKAEQVVNDAINAGVFNEEYHSERYMNIGLTEDRSITATIWDDGTINIYIKPTTDQEAKENISSYKKARVLALQKELETTNERAEELAKEINELQKQEEQS